MPPSSPQIFHKAGPEPQPRNLFIENAPEDSSNLFVRPELFHGLRASSTGDGHYQQLCTLSPGDALVDQQQNMWMIRVAAAPWIFAKNGSKWSVDSCLGVLNLFS